MLQYTVHYPATKHTTINQGSMVSIDTTSAPDSQYYSYSAYSATASNVGSDMQNTAQLGENVSNRRLANTSHIDDASHGESSYNGRFEHSNTTIHNSVAVSSSVPLITWTDLDNEDIALANEVSKIHYYCLCSYFLFLFAYTMFEEFTSIVTHLLYFVTLKCLHFLYFISYQLRVMCLEYGYSLDPHLTPQHQETKQFTA